MRTILDTVTRLDAGDIFSGGALVTLFGIAGWALVKFTQGLCDLYNNLAEQRARERNE